jgi:hypothetical protein
LGVLPCSASGLLDLGAQIRGALGFLLTVVLLLWSEQAVVSGNATPLNKLRAAGYLLMKSKVAAELFLADRGGEGEGRRWVASAVVLLLLAVRGGEEEWKRCAASSASSWWFRWRLLWSCGRMRRLISPLTVHGGVEGGGCYR